MIIVTLRCVFSYQLLSDFQDSVTNLNNPLNVIINNFEQLEPIAEGQYHENGVPYLKQFSVYNKETEKFHYEYEVSYAIGNMK